MHHGSATSHTIRGFSLFSHQFSNILPDFDFELSHVLISGDGSLNSGEGARPYHRRSEMFDDAKRRPLERRTCN